MQKESNTVEIECSVEELMNCIVEQIVKEIPLYDTKDVSVNSYLSFFVGDRIGKLLKKIQHVQKIDVQNCIDQFKEGIYGSNCISLSEKI